MKLPSLFGWLSKPGAPSAPPVPAQEQAGGDMGPRGRDVGWHILFQRPVLSSELTPLTVLQILKMSPAYAAVRLLAFDIAKLPLRGVQAVSRTVAGRTYSLWLPGQTPADAVLRQPNHYQTLFDFVVSWVVSLLLHGVAYVLKEVGPDGQAMALHVLDPGLVTERVARETGDVYYHLGADELAGVTEDMLVPAEFILAHRYLPLTSPLCGSSPLVPAGTSATAKLADLIDGQAVPAGVITGPDSINQAQADEMSQRWLDKFGNSANPDARRGVAVLGSNFRFEMVSRSARDAQLIELAKFGAEDIARALGIQPWLIGAAAPPVGEAMPAAMQLHYTQTLLPIMKPMEQLLSSALIPPRAAQTMRVEFDPMGILALDPMARSAFWETMTGAGLAAPNEGRADFGMLPVPGGDTPYLQQQNYSLGALATRDERDRNQGTDVQAAAMNGAQVTALQGMLVAAAAGELPVEAVRAAVRAAFPLLTEEQVDAMVNPLESFEPAAPQDGPQPAPPQAPDQNEQAISLVWRGTYVPGTTYERGHLVHHHGTTWLATFSTSAAPGNGTAGWSIFAARGRKAP